MGDSRHKHDKSDKAEEKIEKADSAAVKLENIKVAVKEDAKAVFGYLMKKSESSEGKAEAPREIPYEKQNPVLKPSDVSNCVANAITQYESSGKGRVINDHLWTGKAGGAVYIGNQLYFEEGNSMNVLKGLPLRSGKELDLYQEIVRYTKHNDITDPSKKITPDMVMSWSLKVNADNDGNVVIQDALLTAHNVMRALARSEVAEVENLPKDDPVRHIVEDQTPSHKPDWPHAKGLRETIYDKYQLKKGLSEGHDTALFDQSDRYSVFKPLTDYANSSTGSSYHFWVGAFGASCLGSGATRLAVKVEGDKVKGGNKTGQDEKPWGNAGVDMYDKVSGNMHWL